MADEQRRALVPARRAETLEMVKSLGSGFDAEFFHVMERRDNDLIRDEILHGAGSSKFVYSFNVSGKEVSGVSVIGARHLAAHYGGIKHRLVASVQKIGPLLTFTSYPQPGTPMQMRAESLPDLADEPDFFMAVVECEDLKTGNTIQVERRELRHERRGDGSYYERPHYATISQSKAYRNAVLALLPQDVVLKWKVEMLKLGKGESVTDSVLDQKRSAVLTYAAKNALPISRDAVNGLTLDQIAGLGDAAREGKLPMFAQAAQALGLLAAAVTDQTADGPAQTVGAGQTVATGQQNTGAQPAQEVNKGGRPRKQRAPDAVAQTGDVAQQASAAEQPSAQTAAAAAPAQSAAAAEPAKQPDPPPAKSKATLAFD